MDTLELVGGGWAHCRGVCVFPEERAGILRFLPAVL